MSEIHGVTLTLLVSDAEKKKKEDEMVMKFNQMIREASKLEGFDR